LGTLITESNFNHPINLIHRELTENVSNVSVTPVKHRIWHKNTDIFFNRLFYLQFQDLSPINKSENEHKYDNSGDTGYTEVIFRKLIVFMT
jgi:hypothetical protein